MPDNEWNECTEPGLMLRFLQLVQIRVQHRDRQMSKWLEANRLRPQSVTPRKLRLFSCGWCRSLWSACTASEQRAVVAAEEHADEERDYSEMTKVVNAIENRGTPRREPWYARCCGMLDAYKAAEYTEWGMSGMDELPPEEKSIQASIIRDLFGNPFRPVTLDPDWLAWNGGTVQKLAESIYQERAFDRMPILADALEDAGCQDPQILEHCRGKGPHVRGCWAIDLLLGKS